MLETFKKFWAHTEIQTKIKLKCFSSHNGGEYVSKSSTKLCDHREIQRKKTTSFNPPQKDVANRMNRRIQEKVLILLSKVDLTHGFVPSL